MPSSLESSAGVSAARRLVETLVVNGVTHVFCVPGESYLAVLDALHDFRREIEVIVCRHETAAANMAVAYGKLTGKPGVCFVTRGPGATQASVGVHTAQQDSTPMILFIGQVARSDIGRGAFQEVDYPAMFGTLSKLALQIDDPRRVVEITTRAFATALQGRHGPVVVALPEDMLIEDAGPVAPTRVSVAETGVDPRVLPPLTERLEAAQRPLLILGGSGWSRPSLHALADWAQRMSLPVLLSFRRKDLFDNTHPCYAGDLGLGPNPRLIERVRSADLLIAIGARLGESATQGYTLLSAADTRQKLVQFHADPAELNRVWPAALASVASVSSAAFALAGLSVRRSWPQWLADARADLEAFSAPVPVTGTVNLSEVFVHLARALPADAIVCNGAGNYAAWLHRYYRHRGFGTQLAPTSGAMGFGFPAAIAAKLIHPERTVVAVAGDGSFLMAAQELATAVQYGVNVITMVIDNASYGTIRMHQEREYPGRVSATDLRNPDFASFARSFGAWAATVERTEELPAVLEGALSAGRPALIHVKTSLADILPGRTLAGAGSVGATAPAASAAG